MGLVAEHVEAFAGRAELANAPVPGFAVDELQSMVRCGPSMWGTLEYQVMLRILGFDPGPIDGKAASMTEAAVSAFTAAYTAGCFHRDGPTPAHPDLPNCTSLDTATVAALHEAFVLDATPSLDATALHPSHPIAGCGEFNPHAPGDAQLNRRVTLTTYSELPPLYDRAPCTIGDKAACPVAVDHPKTCTWYRAHFEECTDAVHTVFFDFCWLETPQGNYLLSVLCNLPAGSAVSFHVVRDVADFDGSVRWRTDNTPCPARGELVGEVISGEVRQGVCFALWTPPPDWAPDNVQEWFHETDGLPGFRPPLFCVCGPGCWAFSRPPGVRLDRLLVEEAVEPGTVAMSSSGEFVVVPKDPVRTERGIDRFRDEHLQIVGMSALEVAYGIEVETDG